MSEPHDAGDGRTAREAHAAAIEWATFDCYGTLIDWERGITDVLVALLADAGERGAEAARLDRHELALRYIECEAGVEDGEYAPYRDVLARACRRVCSEFGVELPAGREEALPRSLPDWLPFEETTETLLALQAQGVKIAILSNVDRDLIAASIAHIGLEPELIITAQDARSYKPAHGHWREFAAKSGASPGNTLHVGASIYHDMIPAEELGYRTVFINRHAEAVVECEPLASLPDLRDLPRIVHALRTRV
ncbi:MAG: HAD family hydrolase [bacterium]